MAFPGAQLKFPDAETFTLSDLKVLASTPICTVWTLSLAGQPEEKA